MMCDVHLHMFIVTSSHGAFQTQVDMLLTHTQTHAHLDEYIHNCTPPDTSLHTQKHNPRATKGPEIAALTSGDTAVVRNGHYM